MVGRFSIAIVATLLVGSSAFAQDRFESSLQLITMIEAEIDGAPAVGAAIAFGRGKGTVYLVTANHLVRRGGRVASNIGVRLKDAPDRQLAARLTEHFEEAGDIAVLSVNIPPGSPIDACSWHFNVLPIVSSRHRGEEVYPVGNPNGIAWGMPVTPEFVAQAVGEKIVFQSAFVATGHSGGALLSKNGEILGMIQNDQPPYASARTIESIVRQLQEWGYLVELFQPQNIHRNTYYDFFQFAAGEGMAATVDAILRACPGIEKNGAVHFAAEENRVEILGKLIASGGRPNGFENQLAPPISDAAYRGHIEAMKVLLSAGASVELAGWHGERPLQWAVEGGHAEAIELLLERGADVNGADRYGKTPLHWAAYSDKADAAKTLISHGAKVTIRDKDGLSALDYYIESHPGAAMIKLLIAAGADVNAPNRLGRSTPLHDAVRYGRVEIVRVLLEAGAKANAVADGSTPLSIANGSSTKMAQIRELLQAHGASR